MPYIPKSTRAPLDLIIEELGNTVVVDGDLNYILYALCKRHVEPSYNNYKNFCGELRQCATEIERRILAPYEDQKIEENGDII
jgi:hypothetical protein